tara:strand:- start:558 stop:1262 length:705 start_codon:yes stop_codon:yes gene_type:complete
MNPITSTILLLALAACDARVCLLAARKRPQPELRGLGEAMMQEELSEELEMAYNATVENHVVRNAIFSTQVIAGLLVRFRLTAFVSEVGESIRPVSGVRTWHVNLFYLVSWLYVTIDTLVRTVEESRAQNRRPQVWRVLIFMSVFHTIATMLIPAVAIHEAVHLTKAALRAVAATRVERWMPTLVGLLLIPALPLVDHPVHWLLGSALEVVWPRSTVEKPAFGGSINGGARQRA